MRRIEKILRGFNAVVFALLTLSFLFSTVSTRRTASAETLSATMTVPLVLGMTTPTEADLYLSGDLDTLLTDSTSVEVTTNNATGYSLTLAADEDYSYLQHTTVSGARIKNEISASGVLGSAFPASNWGYTVNPGATILSETFLPIPEKTAATEISSSEGPVTSEEVELMVAMKLDGSEAAGTYTNTLMLSLTANAAPTKRLTNISYLQQLDTTVCRNTTTPDPTATDLTGTHSTDTMLVPTATLTDMRDGKTYTVRKLADGNCWMTENLKTTGSLTLSSELSAVTSDFVLPASSTLGDNWSTTPNEAHLYTVTGKGNLYNWYTAVAGTADNTSTSSGTGSICPAGWTLPSHTGTTSIANLISTYGYVSGDSSTVAKIQAAPLSMVPTGYYNQTAVSSEALILLWTKDAASNSNAYIFQYSVNNGSYSVGASGSHGGKATGRPVRCLVSGQAS